MRWPRVSSTARLPHHTTPCISHECQFCQREPTLYGGDVLAPGRLPSIRAVTSGKVSINADGYTYTSAPLNFASANSYTRVASTLETGLNANLQIVAETVNSTITPKATYFTGNVSGCVLQISSVMSGTVRIGSLVCKVSIPCVTSSPDYIGQITAQLAWEPGTITGGVGYYGLFLRNLAAK